MNNSSNKKAKAARSPPTTTVKQEHEAVEAFAIGVREDFAGMAAQVDSMKAQFDEMKEQLGEITATCNTLFDESPYSYIGKHFAKWFEVDNQTNHLCLGEVISYDAAEKWWQIQYEDDEKDDVDLIELIAGMALHFKTTSASKKKATTIRTPKLKGKA